MIGRRSSLRHSNIWLHHRLRFNRTAVHCAQAPALAERKNAKIVLSKSRPMSMDTGISESFPSGLDFVWSEGMAE
jgi:hypothetical protein